MKTEARPQPPTAERISHVQTVHGIELSDDYFWLRERDDGRVRAYLEAENAYTDAMTAHTVDLQDTLYRETLARIKETDTGPPVREDGWLYYSRTVEGLQYAIHCRKHGSMAADEEVLLDENELADGQDYFSLGVFETSPDHTLLAYSTDVTGSEEYRLVIKELTTGRLLDDVIQNTSYSLAWSSDGRTFLYTVLDAAKRAYKVFRHTVGTAATADALVHHETDDAFWCHVWRSTSKRFLFMMVASSTAGETFVASADDPAGEFRLIAPRAPEVEYYVADQGERFLIWTNEDAKNFRLMEAPIDDPGPGSWRELIPHREDTKIETVQTFRDHIVILERRDGLTHLRVEETSTGDAHDVEMPEPVYVVAPGPNPTYDTSTLRFVYTSLVTPTSHFDYDMAARARTLVKQSEVLGGYEPSRYTSERVLVPALDGVGIPMSLVYRKDRPRDGSAPALLYGYGAYGISVDPTFNSNRISLLDRGFVYAIAHVRGGGELGERWREDGKKLKKPNSFTDFIACAEWLVGNGYTAPRSFAIQGASAGGLLMGAIANMRPDLFAVVITQVPFVDVVNTMLDPSLPLTVGEYDEWGDPSDPEYLRAMLSYSPYDNVEAKAYPHVLVTSGLNDPRVQYWEPAKYVAKLRALKTDDHVVLLKTLMETGHAGPSGRYDALRESAFISAFILDRLGLA